MLSRVKLSNSMTSCPNLTNKKERYTLSYLIQTIDSYYKYIACKSKDYGWKKRCKNKSQRLATETTKAGIGTLERDS